MHASGVLRAASACSIFSREPLREANRHPVPANRTQVTIEHSLEAILFKDLFFSSSLDSAPCARSQTHSLFTHHTSGLYK